MLYLITVESIQFIVAQFSLYLWVALPCKFTPSTETSLERAFVLLKLKTDTSTKLLPHEIAKYPKSTIISQLNDSTVIVAICVNISCFGVTVSPKKRIIWCRILKYTYDKE